MALVINGGVCLSSLIWPTSGIRQGCPLSPILFAMLVSPIIHKLNLVSPCIRVLLYADDLLVIMARRGSEFIPSPVFPWDMALWHNIIFCPPGAMTYFSPKLVRAGITLLSDVADKEQFIQQLPMVTKSSYRAGFKRLDQSPRNPLAAYHMPAFWTLWGRKRVAQHLATSEQIKPRQPPEVWTAFLKITCPPRFREFLRLALWRKLPVGSRLNSWLNDGGLCPFHQQLETVPHALTECLFLGVAKSFIHLVFQKSQSGFSLGQKKALATQRASWSGRLSMPTGSCALLLSWTPRQTQYP